MDGKRVETGVDPPVARPDDEEAEQQHEKPAESCDDRSDYDRRLVSEIWSGNFLLVVCWERWLDLTCRWLRRRGHERYRFCEIIPPRCVSLMVHL